MKLFLIILFMFCVSANAGIQMEMLIITVLDKSTLDSKNASSPKFGKRKLTPVSLITGVFALNSNLLKDCNDANNTWFHYKDFLNGLPKRIVDVDLEVIMPMDIVKDIDNP